MMGPTKLSTIREQVRKSFNVTDAELHAWFNRNLEERLEKPGAQTELETLRLLRDALKCESNRAIPKRKPRRASRAKN